MNAMSSWRFMLENDEQEAPDLSYGTLIALPPRNAVVTFLRQIDREDMVEEWLATPMAQSLRARTPGNVPKMGRLDALDIAEGVANNLSALRRMFDPKDGGMTKNRTTLECAATTGNTLENVLDIWDDGSELPTTMVRRVYLGAYYWEKNSKESRRGAVETFAVIDADFRSMTDAIKSMKIGHSAFGSSVTTVARNVALAVASASRQVSAQERAEWLLLLNFASKSGLAIDYIKMATDCIDTGVSPREAKIALIDNRISPQMVVPYLINNIDIDFVRQIEGAA